MPVSYTHLDVYKRQVHALTDASFEIQKGEFCVIVGESGAGKTTLLNILGGMDTLSKGTVPRIPSVSLRLLLPLSLSSVHVHPFLSGNGHHNLAVF